MSDPERRQMRPAESAEAPDRFGSNGSGELAAVGLGTTAEAAYELLVDRPASTIAELTAVWGNVDDITDVLLALEARGLIIRVPGPPNRFAAVAPDVALEALLLSAEEQLQQARDRAGELAERYREHILEPGRNVVELVTGQLALRQRVAQVQRAARHELRCLDRPPYVDSRGTTEVAFVRTPCAGRGLPDGVRPNCSGATRQAGVDRAAGGGRRGRPGAP